MKAMKNNIGKKAKTRFGDGEIIDLDHAAGNDMTRYVICLIRNLKMGEIYRNTILCFLPEEVEIYE